MATRTRSGPYGFADFMELIHEDQKADLIEGAIFIASFDTIEYNDLLGWLHTILGGFIEARGLGKLSVNKVSYRLSTHNAPEPDLGFVRTERANIIKKGYVDGPPDLAVEIVSPDSVHRDYEDKRRLYEEYGVLEYWIIDPDEKKAVFLVRQNDRFVEAPVEAGCFISRAVPGFRLDVPWLWQKPLPKTLPIVQAMLAEQAQP